MLKVASNIIRSRGDSTRHLELRSRDTSRSVPLGRCQEVLEEDSSSPTPARVTPSQLKSPLESGAVRSGCRPNRQRGTSAQLWDAPRNLGRVKPH